MKTIWILLLIVQYLPLPCVGGGVVGYAMDHSNISST